MKITGVCASPKKEDSTSCKALEEGIKGFRQSDESASIEIIKLANYNIDGCRACGACARELTCSIEDDFKNKIMPVLKKSTDAFLFASPVYFGGMPSPLKAFFDRSVSFRRNGFLFASKPAAVITVGGSRNGGQETTLFDILKSCMIHGMIAVPDAPPTSHYGGALWARHPDGYENDLSGFKTAFNTGLHLGQTAKKLIQ